MTGKPDLLHLHKYIKLTPATSANIKVIWPLGKMLRLLNPDAFFDGSLNYGTVYCLTKSEMASCIWAFSFFLATNLKTAHIGKYFKNLGWCLNLIGSHAMPMEKLRKNTLVMNLSWFLLSPFFSYAECSINVL